MVIIVVIVLHFAKLILFKLHLLENLLFRQLQNRSNQ